MRPSAYKDGRVVRLVTRNDIDRAADFPCVVSAIARLPAPTLVLDGEVVIFDDALQRLSSRGERLHEDGPPGSLNKGRS